MKRGILHTVVLLIGAVGLTGCSTPMGFWGAKTTQPVSSTPPAENAATAANSPSGESGSKQGVTSGWGAAFARPFRSPEANTTSPTSAKQDQNPSKTRAALSMAMLSERRGQEEQARHLYEELIRREPNNPTPYWRLGVMAGRAGKTRDAEKYLAKAASLLPNDAELACDLGYIYYLDHRLEMAEKTLRAALEINPDHARASNNLALVLCDQEKDQEAFELFRKVNGPARAYANLGYAYAQRGEIDKAKAAYTRALEIDSSLRPAVDAMVQLNSVDRPSRVNLTGYESPVSADSPVQAIREGSVYSRRSQGNVTVPAAFAKDSDALRSTGEARKSPSSPPKAPEPASVLSPALLNQQQHQKMLDVGAFARQSSANPGSVTISQGAGN